MEVAAFLSGLTPLSILKAKKLKDKAVEDVSSVDFELRYAIPKMEEFKEETEGRNDTSCNVVKACLFCGTVGFLFGFCLGCKSV